MLVSFISIIRYIEKHRRSNMSTQTTRTIVSPTKNESLMAKISSRQLVRFIKQNLKLRIEETNESVNLPASAVKLLVDLLSAMAGGNAVSLIPIQAELTTQQAADLINVSRPFLIKQLEKGTIPFRKVGTHRRILFEDLMRYKEEIDRKRLEDLDELTTQAQDLDMDY